MEEATSAEPGQLHLSFPLLPCTSEFMSFLPGGFSKYPGPVIPTVLSLCLIPGDPPLTTGDTQEHSSTFRTVSLNFKRNLMGLVH